MKYSLYVLLFFSSTVFFVAPITARNQKLKDFTTRVQNPLRLCQLNNAAGFCALNVTNDACIGGNAQINGDLNVSGIISGQDGLGYGNTLIVDQVDGNDTTGTVNGPRFKTISAALAQAQPGDVVWVFPGTYNETVTIPDLVILKALCRDAVTIQQLDVTEPTDLVTMGEGSYIGDFVLLLTSSEPVQLRAIYHPGLGTSNIIVIDTNVIMVTNTSTGASDTYGIYMTGVGTVGFLGDIIFSTIIQITSSGAGKKRGIYINSPTLLEILIPIVQMFGGTDTIAFEVNNSACVAAVQSGAFAGDFYTGTPDISQTQGTLDLDSTYLGNSNANGLGFTDLTFPQTLIFGDPDSYIGDGTFYLFPGGAGATSNPIPLAAPQKGLAFIMSVKLGFAAGDSETVTFTLQINGVDTPMALTLTDSQTEAILTNISVHFNQGDKITLKMENSAGSLAGEALVSLSIY